MRKAGLIALALTVLPFAATPLSADRYRVEVSTLPPLYGDDAVSRTLQLEPDPAVLPAGLGGAALAVPAPAAVTPPPALPGVELAAAKMVPAIGQGPLHSSAELGWSLAPAASPPSAVFLARMQQIYSMTDPVVLGIIWKWWLVEPANLSLDSRNANSLHRYVVATGDLAAPGMQAPARLPNATQGTVLAVSGGLIRVAPWDVSIGTAPYNSTVTLIPPAAGEWHRVAWAGGIGWLTDQWLQLR